MRFTIEKIKALENPTRFREDIFSFKHQNFLARDSFNGRVYVDFYLANCGSADSAQTTFSLVDRCRSLSKRAITRIVAVAKVTYTSSMCRHLTISVDGTRTRRTVTSITGDLVTMISDTRSPREFDVSLHRWFPAQMAHTCNLAPAHPCHRNRRLQHVAKHGEHDDSGIDMFRFVETSSARRHSLAIGYRIKEQCIALQMRHLTGLSKPFDGLALSLC